MTKYYLVRLGGDLYVATRWYHFFQDTVRGPEKAYRFATYDDAEKVRRKTIGGIIEEYTVNDADEKDNNADLINMIKKQQEQIDELTKILNEKIKKND